MDEVVTIKTYYLEKMDKPIIFARKIKIEKDNLKTCLNLEKESNIKKIVDRLLKNEATHVVISEGLINNRNLVNALNANGLEIFDGRWLIKYIAIEILNYIIDVKKLRKQEIEIAITTNEITDLVIETIKIIVKQYKRTTVVTNHIEKFRKIEKDIYNKDGILISVLNNQKKSLLRPQVILNMDFNKELLNKYNINLEGDMKIENKRFNGVNINDYQISVGREELVWRENMKDYREKDLFEAMLYTKDTFKNIRKKIFKSNITIKELYGINGKI